MRPHRANAARQRQRRCRSERGGQRAVLESMAKHAWGAETDGPCGPAELPRPLGIVVPISQEGAAARKLHEPLTNQYCSTFAGCTRSCTRRARRDRDFYAGIFSADRHFGSPLVLRRRGKLPRGRRAACPCYSAAVTPLSSDAFAYSRRLGVPQDGSQVHRGAGITSK